MPLSEDPGAWPGASPEPGKGSVKRVVSGWDVEIESERWAVRRGDELAVTVTVGRPDATRDGVEAGLVCEASFDLQQGSQDSGYHRRTRKGTVLEALQGIDPAVHEQTVRLRVPEDAPFTYSHDGGAFGLEWKLVAREDRRLRRDPRREATIHVSP